MEKRQTSLCAPPSIDDLKYDSDCFRFFHSSKVLGEIEEELVQPNRWPPNAAVEFDWTIPTNIVYRQKEDDQAKGKPLFAPRFSEARSKLDYSYHKNPEIPRQIFQDALLKRILNAAPDPATDSENKKDFKGAPTIVFTAGPMGVGKSYVLTQLYERGLFPLDDFVKIDPDMIKTEIPEFAGYQDYLRKNPSNTTAATQVHRESTQLSDILFEHSLSSNLNILVDGSLRDVDWYQQLFTRLKEEFPQYRLVILYVSASDEVILSRAKSRAETTGREVPKDLLRQSMEQVPQSVHTLKNLSNTTLEITNNDNEALSLKQLYPLLHEEQESDDWSVLDNLWSKTDEESRKQHQRERMPLRHSIICNMQDVFNDSNQHKTASKIWGAAYPLMCPRCALSCDEQCGVCIHGRHSCACELCKSPNPSSVGSS